MRYGARGLIAGLAILVVFGASARAEDDSRPDATPYRPTVSTPAALSAPHWLEAEIGGAYLRGPSDGDASPLHRNSFPYTLKYAFSEDWGVRIGGEAMAHASHDGDRTTGFGDTGLVVKRRFAVDDTQAFGLELGALYPTARPALHLGSGKPDYAANGIWSVDFAGWHSDVNVIGTRLGARDDAVPAVSRWQTTSAVALSHPLVDRWQIEGEVSGTRQHGMGSTAQFLGALAWSARRDLVFDFGGARGMNRATAPWQAFAGMTVVLGRID